MPDFDFSPYASEAKGFPSKAEVAGLLDKTFGKGKWTLTSGFRPESREDVLRRQGAGTVPKSAISSHSLGTEDRPGAWDVVVPGMSASQVAQKLQSVRTASGDRLTADFPEGQHGAEGAHVHFGFGEESIAPLAKDAGADFDFSKYAKDTPLQKAQSGGYFQRHPTQAQFGSGVVEGAIGAPQAIRDIAMPSPLSALGGISQGADAIATLIKDAFTGASDMPKFGAGMPTPAPGPLDKVPVAGPPKNLLQAATRFGGQVLGAAPLAGVDAEEVDAARSASNVASLTRKPEAGYYPGMSDKAFRRQQYADALAPIREQLPRNIPAGREGLKYVAARNDAAYDKAMQGVRVPDDSQQIAELAELRTDADHIDPSRARRFERFLNNRVLNKYQKDGIDGRDWQAARRDLRYEARRLSKAPDPADQDMAEIYQKAADSMTGAFTRSQPAEKVAQLRDADRTFARRVRLEEAAGNRATSKGEFTPADVLAVEKANEGKRGMGQSRGLLQPSAEAAHMESGGLAGQISRRATGAILGSVLGGPVGAMAGLFLEGPAETAVRGALGRLGAARAARSMARGGPNYLKAIDRRVLAAPAVRLALPPPQQQ